MIRDIRFAIRNLLQQKTFTLSSLVTLALGIGATTAVFSVISGIVFRPLPFREPERLVQLYGTPASRGEAVDHLLEFRDQSTSFTAMAGYGISARYLQGPAGVDRVMTVVAERGFFDLLGVQPVAGRTFRVDDTANVAVVSETFWKDRLASLPIGSTVVLDGQAATIIGIMPEWFQFPYGAASTLGGTVSQERTDMWMPLDPPQDPALRARWRFNYVTARLKPGITIGAADTELGLIGQRLQMQNPDPYGPRGVRIEPLLDTVVSPPIRHVLFLLFAAVGIVLALACVNVTNLSLGRMTLRNREVAVRSAIGASRAHLVQQFLVESLLLSFAGGLVGILIAWAGTAWLKVIAASQLPRVHEIRVDWRVFAFLFATCTVAALLFTLGQAMVAMRTPPSTILQRAGTHFTMGIAQRRLRAGLVIAEVALAFILATGAALLTREIVRLRNTDPGMVTKNVATLHVGHRMISRGRERPFDTDVRQFYDIAEQVRQLPDVRAAGFIQALPLQNWGWQANSNDFVRNRDPQPPPFPIELRYVTPGYFQALGIPLRKGRGFGAGDNRDSPGVIIVNEALAQRYFGSQDPIGLQTTRGVIVGVVGNVRQVHLDRPAAPEVYYPLAQNWSQTSELGMTLVLSTRNRTEASLDAVRRIIRDVNPNLAVFNIKSMDEVVAESLADFTLYLSLIATFAVLAVALALTGTYGVISFTATSRMREFAIRFAVGADTWRVMRLILIEAFMLTALGIALGLCITFVAAPVLTNLPVSVRPPDAATATPIALLIGVIAIAAALFPARRAARPDLVTVLRNE
jgi:predicted permease